MRMTQLVVGKLYMAKVSGRVVPVRLDRIAPAFDGTITRFHVTNTVTGRSTVFRSATKFRCPAHVDDPNEPDLPGR